MDIVPIETQQNVNTVSTEALPNVDNVTFDIFARNKLHLSLTIINGKLEPSSSSMNAVSSASYLTTIDLFCKKKIFSCLRNIEVCRI